MSDYISKKALLEKLKYMGDYNIDMDYVTVEDIMSIPSADIGDNRWISFSDKLPDKGRKVLISTYGIVTIGERTSDANESLRLSILEPMNNLYKNIDPKQYQITHWQSLPKGY